MSDAYKCERCGEFEEGYPKRLKVRTYASAGFTGWADATTRHKTELCERCWGEFQATVETFFGVDDE